MKTIDDVKVIEGKRNSVLAGAFTKVEVNEYGYGIEFIFRVNQHKSKSIFVQVDYDLDSMVDSMYEWRGDYYILADYFDIAE